MIYKLKETYPNIFTVVVQDSYDRAMLFCRVQEYYESQNERFKGKKFSFWDYHRWYAKTSKIKKNSFSYPADWSGFNFPAEIAFKCQKISKVETPYDVLMNKILRKIKIKNSYIIGVESINSSIYKHELCHGFFYTNKDYKKEMLDLNRSLNKNIYKKLKLNLLNLGYHNSVLDDEIQAYLATGPGKLLKGTRNKNICNKYNKIFKKYL